jgi:hypothetical protein
VSKGRLWRKPATEELVFRGKLYRTVHWRNPPKAVLRAVRKAVRQNRRR